MSKGGDAMEVWWIAPDGSVQAACHDSGWSSLHPGRGRRRGPTGGITAVFKGGDAMEVWWIAPDGSVQAAWHDSGSSWNPYTLAGPGRFAHRIDRRRRQGWRRDGGVVGRAGWFGPGRLARQRQQLEPVHPGRLGQRFVTGGIAGIFKGGDAMEVWWVAPDGSVQAARHDSGSTWNPYTLAGPGSASPTCRITSAYGGSLVADVMRVWWVDATGTTYQAFFDSEWAVSPIGAGAGASGAIVGVLFNPDTPTTFWALPDGSLVDAHPPEITLSAHVSGGNGLRGTVWLTLRADGSTRWHGDVTNSEAYGYNFAVSVFAQTGSSADIGAAHDGHVAGWAEPGSSNDIWDEEHQPSLALTAGVAGYRFSGLSLKLQDSVDLVDYLEAALDAIFEAAVAVTIAQAGAVILIGVEIGSLLATGSLVPGAVIAGGMPWLAGPAGILVRAFVTASNSDGRQLTEEEYAWANDMVYRGSLPPIDSFRITNYIGAEDRPFTFPTFGGPTLVNLRDDRYNDLHSDEATVIHELVHVCQIAHTQNLVFTATAIAPSSRTNSRTSTTTVLPASITPTSASRPRPRWSRTGSSEGRRGL